MCKTSVIFLAINIYILFKIKVFFASWFYINVGYQNKKIQKNLEKNFKTIQKLYEFVDNKAKKLFEKKKESAKKDAIKYKKWRLDSEKRHQKILRLQRETRRKQVHLPNDSAGLNLEVLFFTLRRLFVIFILCNILYNWQYSVTWIYKFIIIVLFLYFYGITHSLINKLVLRKLRFSWTRGWPLVLPVYIQGYNIFYIYHILFLFYIKLPTFVMLF